jgi:hypothetical protein
MSQQYISYSSRNSGSGGGVSTLNGLSGALTLVAGSGISIVPSGGNITISATGGGGTVTSVTASSPLFSSGGTTPNLTIQVANTTQNGYLSSTDWNAFNGKFNLPALTSGSVLFSNGTTIAQDNTNFFWDETNKRLGIGTATPSQALDIAVGNLIVDNGFMYCDITLADANINNPFQAIGYFSYTVDPTANGANYTGAVFSNLTLSGGFSTVGPYTFTGFVNSPSASADSSTIHFDTFIAEAIYQELQSTGTTTYNNVTGKYININMQGGIAVSYYGLRMNDAASAAPSGTNAITNYYGVYSEASPFATKQNWLAGRSLLGFSSFSSPTATLQLPGGTTAASSSPLKINSGTLMTATEHGAIESDGTHLYWTNNSGTRLPLDTSGTGTVTSVSVVSTNGLAGTVANPTTTPAITLSTTITGLLKGNGTAISAAISGTDYQPAGNYITALTGDATATGPGSVALTLATVNSNVGSFGSSTSIPSFTVNAKGLITAASGNAVVAPAGTLTGTTLASNVVSSSLTSLGSSAAVTNNAGGFSVTTRTITANLTIDTTTTDYIIFCNQSGAITITLPTPTNGRQLIIKDISGTAATNNITIARHGTETIEGVSASYVLSANYVSVTLTSDGTNWWLV